MFLRTLASCHMAGGTVALNQAGAPKAFLDVGQAHCTSEGSFGRDKAVPRFSA